MAIFFFEPPPQSLTQYHEHCSGWTTKFVRNEAGPFENTHSRQVSPLRRISSRPSPSDVSPDAQACISSRCFFLPTRNAVPGGSLSIVASSNGPVVTKAWPAAVCPVDFGNEKTSGTIVVMRGNPRKPPPCRSKAATAQPDSASQ